MNKYCNIYGEGQLFAFSALEGDNFYSDHFVGVLTRDFVGVKFYSKDVRTIYNDHDIKNVKFDIVSSDCIEYKWNNKRYVNAFIKNKVIVGLSDCIKVKGKYIEKKENDITYHYSFNAVSALYKNDDRFIFVYAKNKKEAKRLIEENINFDIDGLLSNRKKFIASVVDNSFNDETLASKCLSVMKTQLYSKEGIYNSYWSTPDRLPHKKMWLWDSVYHAIGYRHIDVNIAMEILEAIFVHQSKDGFIPHMMTPNSRSKITQPPIIMYGALKVYETSNDREFLRRVYDHNKLFLNWIHNNRRYNNLYLYSWNTTSKVTCKCDESGMDNSSRFDTDDKLYAIDFSCFMANETRLMSKVASILNLKDDEEYYKEFNTKIANDINSYLYDSNKGFYFDYDIDKNKLHEVYSVCSFLPLLSKTASKLQAENLVKYLNDESYFKTEFMIPTIAKADSSFSQDMWRGPVWINYNYMIIDGLKEYGYDDLANYIKKQTIDTMKEIYLKTGVIFEFYDYLNKTLPNRLERKGPLPEEYGFKNRLQTIRDYGWSNTLLFDLLHK